MKLISSRAMNKIALNYSVLSNHNISPPDFLAGVNQDKKRFGKGGVKTIGPTPGEKSTQIVIEDALIKKTLRKVAPKVMKYEKELNKIRNELGE